MTRATFIVASLFGLLGVAGGAFGAHSLRGHVSPDLLAVFETGIRYQMYHAFALFAAGWALQKYRLPQFQWAAWGFLIGVALFSGSLYIMALTGILWVGIITPFGGVALLTGWFFMGLGFWKIQ
jgi:uncharacterized membrane protein YgdD (TMEM256/DUF423 family)